jgi:hypothetical protein
VISISSASISGGKKKNNPEIRFASPSATSMAIRPGRIEVDQGEANHFAVELEAVAAFLRAALMANRKSQAP